MKKGYFEQREQLSCSVRADCRLIKEQRGISGGMTSLMPVSDILWMRQATVHRFDQKKYIAGFHQLIDIESKLQFKFERGILKQLKHQTKPEEVISMKVIGMGGEF